MEPENPLNNPSPASAGEETSLPDPSAMGLSPAPKKKNSKKGIIIGAAAAVVVLLLIVLVVAAVARPSTNQDQNKQQLQSQFDAGYQKAKEEAEAESRTKAAQEYYIYKSPVELGSFELPMPKNWSFNITPNISDGTFLAIADPTFINTGDERHVFSFDLKGGNYNEQVTEYDTISKEKGTPASDITVSGIKGRRYTLVTDDENGLKSEVVVLPYREKILFIKTDDPGKYGEAFNKLLGLVKLNQ